MSRNNNYSSYFSSIEQADLNFGYEQTKYCTSMNISVSINGPVGQIRLKYFYLNTIRLPNWSDKW